MHHVSHDGEVEPQIGDFLALSEGDNARFLVNGGLTNNLG